MVWYTRWFYDVNRDVPEPAALDQVYAAGRLVCGEDHRPNPRKAASREIGQLFGEVRAMLDDQRLRRLATLDQTGGAAGRL